MLQLLFCSIMMQNIRTFYGVPVMFVITCFLENNQIITTFHIQKLTLI